MTRSETKSKRTRKRPEGQARETRGAEAFSVSPFARLARSHSCSAAGDALFTIALADSLFFSIDPNDARWQLALYLLVTVAPFAFVAPWLGPAMDKLQGGHRYMLIGSAAIRSILALAVARYIGSFGLFPLAFSMLVMGKAHHVAKSALVPGIVVGEEGLVKANSRLSIISAISAATIGIPGIIFLKVGGAPYVMTLAAVVFVTGAVLGTRIPATKVAAEAPDRAEKAELRGAGIVLAASAMGYVRGVTGFLTMLLAFELRGGIDPGPIGAGVEVGHRIREALGPARLDLASGGAPKWHFGLVLATMGIGGLLGAGASPRLRAHASEERILAGALGGVAVFGLIASLSGGVVGAMLVAFAIAVAGQIGKQSFDAIVQRDAPKANLGRSFSRFESRFQLVWVVGALIPVIVPIPARIGFGMVAAASAFAAISYAIGRNPAPSAARPRAGVKSALARSRGRSNAETDGVSTDLPVAGGGPDLGPSATPVSGAAQSGAAEPTTKPGQGHPIDPSTASLLDVPSDPTRSIFDAPSDSIFDAPSDSIFDAPSNSIFDAPDGVDEDFSTNFDFGNSGDKTVDLSQGYEPTTKYELPVDEPTGEPVEEPADKAVDKDDD